jgi:hypothetical protein
MVDSNSKTFSLSLNGASLEALETSLFLDVAIQLIQARKFELEKTNPILSPVNKRDSSGALPEAVGISGPSDRTEVVKVAVGRWFKDRILEVHLADGNSCILRSLDELKAFIGERGLTPHPRGDASMLIWQLRNRLGLEAVAISPDYR